MPVPTGVIRNPQGTALIALVDMATQFCCTANLDRPHDTKVTNRHLMTMSLSIRRPKGPEDIRNF
jgi:hypothetical protein